MKITYLTLEAPREGQASYVHIHEIIAGFQKSGVEVTLYQPAYTSKPQSPGLWAKGLSALYACTLSGLPFNTHCRLAQNSGYSGN
jgi:hypothetical protein